MILVSKNTEVKFDKIDKLPYFNGFMSLPQSELNSRGMSARLLVMLDLISADELTKTPNMKLKTTIFHKSISASQYQIEVQPQS